MSKLKKNSHPLHKYHPVRFAAGREGYITEAMNILLRDFLDGAYPIFELPAQTRKEIDTCFYRLILQNIKSSISKEFYPTYLKKMYQMCESYYMLSNEAGSELLSEYFQSYHNDDLIIFEDYTAFQFYGSNIFEFPSNLLDLFAQTDVDSVLLRDIHLPFSTIYIHFGKQEDIKLYGNISYIIEKNKSQLPSTPNQDIHFLLDGAYISQCPDTKCLRVTFTSVKTKQGKYNNNCIDDYEEIISLTLEAVSTETSIYENVELIRKILLKDKIYQTSELDIDTTINQIVNYLKLAINCVLYLQSYPEDVNEDYPESAPTNLVSQTKRNSGVKAIAEKKLNQLGYRKIKFCGNNRRLHETFSPTPDDSEATPDEDKRTMQPHRRRTHIRKQRYGKGLELWRYVWIKETTIHKDKYQNSPQQYRIYEVSE